MRKIPVNIVMTGETEKDYKDTPTDQILDEFLTYYNLIMKQRDDFKLEVRDCKED
jgi:hypothetical protein